MFYDLFHGRECLNGNKNTRGINTVTTSGNRVAYFLYVTRVMILSDDLTISASLNFAKLTLSGTITTPIFVVMSDEDVNSFSEQQENEDT